MEAVNINWIKSHFTTGVPDFAHVYIDLAASPCKYVSLFILTIGSIKYRWDWITEEERDIILAKIEKCLYVIKQSGEVKEEDRDKHERMCESHVNNLRTYLQDNGWIIMP